MFQFVIWGAGNRGTDVINVLGKERIVAVVDKSESKQGTTIREISVISPEDYYKHYTQYMIIITPEGYEEDIDRELREKGIFWSFLYKTEFSDAETYMLQAPKKVLIEKCRKEKCQYIYGFTLLGLLMYEYFADNGFESCLIVQASRKRLLSYILKQLKIKVAGIENSKDVLHLSIPLETNDKCSEEVQIITYYDLIEKDIFTNPRISVFKNIHRGERCFIVGTGPSLRMSDLETLRLNHEICISMNGIYKGFDKTKWRPDYYVVGDLDATYYGRDSILDMEVPHKFIADVAWNFGEEREGIYKWHLVRRWKDGEMPKFTDDFSKRSYAGLTITYDGALQLAAYMGFSEIYLLGIDCSNYNSTGTAHFFDSYGRENKDETGYLKIDANIMAYMAAEKYAREHGFKIYNATRGGKLEVFERKGFDSLF